jgi:hypothetical protein
MGSGISQESINIQEEYVENKYNNIRHKYPNYTKEQIKGKLRQQFNNVYVKDSYILDIHWKERY